MDLQRIMSNTGMQQGTNCQTSGALAGGSMANLKFQVGWGRDLAKSFPMDQEMPMLLSSQVLGPSPATRFPKSGVVPFHSDGIR
jgi:hypothetical protein